MNIRIDRIKELQHKSGYTVAQMAEIAGCNIASYYKYQNENDKTRNFDLYNLCNIADAFGCDLDYLLDRQNCTTKVATDIQEETGLSEEAINKIRKASHDYSNALAILSFNTFDYCVCNGLTDITNEMQNFFIAACMDRMPNIPKEIKAIANSAYKKATTDPQYIMDPETCYMVKLQYALAKIDMGLLQKYDSIHFSDSSQTHVPKITSILQNDLSENDRFDKDIVPRSLINTLRGKDTSDYEYHLITNLCRKIFKYTYMPLYFQYSIDAKKYAISNQFNRLLDKFLNDTGIEKR